MLFSSERLTRIRNEDPQWLPKLSFRFCALATSIISLSLSLSRNSYDGLIILAPAIPSILWNLANIIRRFTRTRPLPHGANVGVDLIIWLIYAAIGIILSVTLTSYSYGYSYGYYSSSYYNSPRKILGLSIAVATFVWLATILHFALFVWACIDEHHRRQRASEVRIAAALIRQQQQPLAVWIPSSQLQKSYTQSSSYYAPHPVPPGQDDPGGYWQVLPQWNAFASTRPSVPSAAFRSPPTQHLPPDMQEQTGLQDRPGVEERLENQRVNLQEVLLQAHEGQNQADGYKSQQNRESSPLRGYFEPQPTQSTHDMKEKSPIRGYYGDLDSEIGGEAGPSSNRG